MKLPPELILETIKVELGDALVPICRKTNEYGRQGFIVTNCKMANDLMANDPMDLGDEAMVEIWGYKDVTVGMPKDYIPLADVQVLLDALKIIRDFNASCDSRIADRAIEAFNRARQAGGGE